MRGFYEYKLIATDMDGTLLDEEHAITKENIEAIIKVQREKGVKFVLASGRPSYAMLEYAKELQMDKYEGYVLAFNGGELIDMKTNEVIFHEGLEKKDIENVYKVSKEINVPMILYVGDTIYGTEATEGVMYEADQCKMKFQKFDSLEELEKKGIDKTTKCMIIGTPEEVLIAEEHMNKVHGNDYFIAISKPIFLEIANKNVDKGKTLKKLGEIENIKPEEMIAVGDSANDKPLLKLVGMPVAVENAIPEIKSISKFISTSNVEHGLKTVIEKFFEI